MVNQSKKGDTRRWNKWIKSGAVGTVNGRRAPGEAYAFFNCNASLDQIAGEIPNILLANPSKRLEVYLAQRELPLMDKSYDSELIEIAQEAKDAGIRYVMAARSSPTMTNRETADELASILNQAYNSSLYKEGEKFRGEIVYKETRGGYQYID